MNDDHEHDTLAEVIAARRRLREDPRSSLDRDRVLRWSASGDIDALGALSSMLFHPDESRQIAPSLTLADYLRIELPYLERCFREDPQGEWADSRWQAGGLLANWIKSIWRDERFRGFVDTIRDWLARLYKSTEDPDLRKCLVQATLEHAFEAPGIAERFEAWREDPILREAYDEARLWKEGLDELGMQPVDHRSKR
ncbi:MAG TPA: hypothetical protein VIC28_07940 [Thermoanaerobaculia bacterium]|jgi:hypothetical protein